MIINSKDQKLLIMGKVHIKTFKPEPFSLLIRILQVNEIPNELKFQSFFKKILIYNFNDKKELTKESFNQKILKQLKKDTQKIKEDFDTIIIHCSMGLSRSPAIALGLNHIYKLGFNERKIKKLRPRYNKFIYNLIKGIG